MANREASSMTNLAMIRTALLSKRKLTESIDKWIEFFPE
jgi:hypothetical protein